MKGVILLNNLMSYFLDYQHTHSKLPNFCILHKSTHKPFRKLAEQYFNVSLQKEDEILLMGVRVCFSTEVPVDAIILGEDVSIFKPITEVL